MTDATGPMLVPELLVRDLDASLAFWCGICGFDIRYSRPEEGFAYLALGGAHVMLEQVGVGRNWITGDLEPPLGRGINLQIGVDDLDSILTALEAAAIAPFMPPEVKRYRTGEFETSVRQFLVTDADGYLIRFQSPVSRG